MEKLPPSTSEQRTDLRAFVAVQEIQALGGQLEYLLTDTPIEEIKEKKPGTFIPIPEFAVLGNDIATEAKVAGYEKKKSHHLTVIGSETLLKIKEIVETKTPSEKIEIARTLSRLFETTPWSYIPSPLRFRIAKSYPETTPQEERASFIQAFEVPELERFYKELNDTLGTEFPVPFPHVTLFTKSSNPEKMQRGIGIYSEEDLSPLHAELFPMQGETPNDFQELAPTSKRTHETIEEGYATLVAGINAKLAEHPTENILVLIAGPSASGKSTMAEKLLREYAEAGLLNLDRYYIGETAETKASGEEVNFSVPSALDADRIRSDIEKLLTLPPGTPVLVPIYGMKERARIGEEEISAKRILIVEGVYPLLEVPIATPFRVYIESTVSERLGRKIRRDTLERGMKEDEVRRRFENYSEPARLTYIEPQKGRATLVIQNPEKA